MISSNPNGDNGVGILCPGFQMGYPMGKQPRIFHVRFPHMRGWMFEEDYL